MIGKLTKRHVTRGMNTAKNFLGQTYHTTRNMLGNVDKGVNAFKQVYGAVALVLESYGVPTGHKQVMKALTGYDTIKKNVMEGHGRVMADARGLANTLAPRRNVRFEFAS